MTSGRPPAPLDPSTRRDVLKVGAALAGLSVLASCAATGGSADARRIPKAKKRAPLGPDDTIRLGLIGPGGMGNGHLDSIMALNKVGLASVQFVALCDVCKPRLDAAVENCAKQQNMPVAAYRDHRDLLARPDLNGVLIATPEHWHAPMVVDAIEQGLDVYCEKPLCLQHEDALWVKRVVEANDRILQVGTQYMMYPRYKHARRLIAEGKIGHPTLTQTSYCRNSKAGEWLYEIDERVQPGEMLDWKRWCGPLGEIPFDTKVYHRWRRYKRWSTGIIGDLLVHMMTPLMYAVDAGWPVRVSAVGGHYVDKEMENHDQVFLTIEFEKDHTMIVAGSTCNEMGLEVMIRGHEANLYLGGNNCVLRPERVFSEEVEEQTIQCEGMNEQDELRLDWMRSMRTREPNQSPIELAAKCMVIVDLATRSMWGQSAWLFDPETLTAKPA